MCSKSRYETVFQILSSLQRYTVSGLYRWGGSQHTWMTTECHCWVCVTKIESETVDKSYFHWRELARTFIRGCKVSLCVCVCVCNITLISCRDVSHWFSSDVLCEEAASLCAECMYWCCVWVSVYVCPNPWWKVIKCIYLSTNHKERMKWSQFKTDPLYPESSTGRRWHSEIGILFSAICFDMAVIHGDRIYQKCPLPAVF